MLKSARESGGGFIEMGDDGNDANSTMVELGEQQFAQALAANGGFGIAKTGGGRTYETCALTI